MNPKALALIGMVVLVSALAEARENTGKAVDVDKRVHGLVERMQAFYERTQDFRATFHQEYTYKTFNRRQVSSGTVLFKKPAMMRWDYEKPSPRTFVLEGDKAYSLDPDALTLTKANIKSNELSASVTFLWGKGKLSEEFKISPASCDHCHGELLRLVPLKPDSRFREILLEVDPKTAQVLASTVIDPDGSENRITFSDLKTNVGASHKDFELNVPEGTQVIDMTKRPGP